MVKIPFISIPFVRYIDEYDIGFWIWAKPDNLKHRVYIERREEILIAGVDIGEVRLISGMWRGSPGHPLDVLLDYRGDLAQHMNTDLTNDEMSERIWDFLQGQAITMQLVVINGKEEASNENYLYATRRSVWLHDA